jgi:hypothetical protein
MGLNGQSRATDPHKWRMVAAVSCKAASKSSRLTTANTASRSAKSGGASIEKQRSDPLAMGGIYFYIERSRNLNMIAGLVFKCNSAG